MSRPGHFLLATWDGGGVIPPQLEVCRELRARGHSVTVLADPTVEPEATHAGCAFRPWVTAPHRNSRQREDDILTDYAAKSPLAYMDLALERFMRDPGPRWVTDTLHAVDELAPDVVLTDSALPWVVLAAEAARRPSAVLHTTVYTLPTPGIPPAGFGLAPASHLLHRLRDAALRRVHHHFWNKTLPALNAERARHALEGLRSATEQTLACDRFLVLSSAAFDLGSPFVPANVRWVGPRLADPSWAEPWSPPWPESDERPLVVAMFSSTFQDHAGLLGRVVDALALADVRGLVTLGPALHGGEVEAKKGVVVVPSAPHAAVLRQASAAITHGGHGSMLKALAAGVPVVCVPIGRDQPDVAVRLELCGAGIRLDKRADVYALAHALRRVVDEPAWRAQAARMSTHLRTAVEPSAAEELEALLPT